MTVSGGGLRDKEKGSTNVKITKQKIKQIKHRVNSKQKVKYARTAEHNKLRAIVCCARELNGKKKQLVLREDSAETRAREAAIFRCILSRSAGLDGETTSNIWCASEAAEYLEQWMKCCALCIFCILMGGSSVA